jgi:hypothetical protein
MIGDKFIINDNDVPEYVLQEARIEAEQILNSDYTVKTSLSGRIRTLDDIQEDVLLGKIGEFLIKTKYNYTNDDAKWHDLISPGGQRTEVKTWRKHTITSISTDREINKLRRRKSSVRKWFFSTKLIIVSFDVTNNEFEIIGIYDI